MRFSLTKSALRAKALFAVFVPPTPQSSGSGAPNLVKRSVRDGICGKRWRTAFPGFAAGASSPARPRRPLFI
jgi:hypothetical protein